jgi:hypothetical protein
MKIKLQDYSLISNEVLKEKLEYYESMPFDDCKYIEGKIDLLKDLIGNHCIPSEKLAEVSFDSGHEWGTTDTLFNQTDLISRAEHDRTPDKQEFLTSEIEI